jgi:hypothetical protein
MRIKWAERIAAAGLILLGMVMLVVAVFAYQLQIDHNQAWGPERKYMAILGALLLLVIAALHFPTFLHRFFSSAPFQKFYRLIQWMGTPFTWLFIKITPERNEPHKRGIIWYAAAGAAIAFFISLWYITSGRMVVFTPYSAYFDRQANAFLAGQLSLLEKPPAALLALANPYQYQNRVGVGNYIWDATLYKGKYYLYWGPMPALWATLGKLIHPAWVVEDQYLILFSIAAMAIGLAAIFYWLQKEYFPNIPGWMVLALTLLGVLNTPVFWLVNRPDVYEASIASGQCFTILGLYAAMRGLQSQKHRVLLLALAGFSWGAAIGSRLDLGVGIAWMVLLICIFLLLKTRNWPARAGAFAAMTLPLLLWGAGLAWFNYARFGNVLETGFRFQLTGGALPADTRNLTSASYILPNIYNLLARPMEVHWREFPFLFTPLIRNEMWPKLIFYPRNSNYFYNEPIAGAFISIPTIWFLLIPLLVIPSRFIWNWLNERPLVPSPILDQPLSTWVGGMVLGAFFCNLGVLTIYIASTMRYEANLTPLLTVLVGLGLGWASIRLHNRPRLWRTVLLFVGISILISILIGLLANFQNGDWIFKNNNPELFQAIENLFTLPKNR